jgi:ABC-type lipoprotein release transport system permease subunit
MISATVCYIFLPASPETAKFLTEEEKRIGTLRIRLETLTNSQNKLKKLHFKLAIFNVKTWLNALGLFCSLLCMNSIALFMVIFFFFFFFLDMTFTSLLLLAFSFEFHGV